MGDVSNELIYNILCELKQDIGHIKGATEATAITLAQHVQDDKKMVRDIYDLQISPIAGQVKTLELAAERAKGAARTWGIVGASVASVVGGLAGLLGHIKG